jgi:hypothetical protein
MGVNPLILRQAQDRLSILSRQGRGSLLFQLFIWYIPGSTLLNIRQLILDQTNLKRRPHCQNQT